MAKRKKQLKILGPDQENPTLAFWEVMGMTLLICVVLSIVSLEFVWFSPDDPSETTQEQQKDTRTSAQKLSETLADLPPETLAARQYTDEEALAVAKHGPRLAAERVCEQQLDDADEEVVAAMTAALEARVEHAPRICAVRAYLNGLLFEQPAFEAATAEYWAQQIETFEESSGQIGLMITNYKETRQRPEDPRFYRWLRHCAMRTESDTWVICMEMVRQMSPHLGADVLSMVEMFFQQVEDPTTDELAAAASVLRLLAKNGQPGFWKRSAEQSWPTHDEDIRRGAVFYLCRMTQSPDQEVARAAAQNLGELSEIGGRAVYKKKLWRWREACKLAFGGERPDLEFVDAPEVEENYIPALAIWDGQKDSDPHYSILQTIGRGDCTKTAERPVWFCGVSLWQGLEETEGVAATMARYFVDTRYIEWAYK